MKPQSITALLLTVALALAPAVAQAKNDGKGGPPTPVANPVAVCAISDLQAASACSGYFAGNLNGGSSDKVAAQQSGLAAIGFNWDGKTTIEKIESFSGNAIAFSQPLFGTSFVSIHYGAGNGPDRQPGGVTGFYKIETGSALTSLATRFGSLSNAVLYTSILPPGGGGSLNIGAPDIVPEPAVWLQLIAGFGLVGFFGRQRRQTRQRSA